MTKHILVNNYFNNECSLYNFIAHDIAHDIALSRGRASYVQIWFLSDERARIYVQYDSIAV